MQMRLAMIRAAMGAIASATAGHGLPASRVWHRSCCCCSRRRCVGCCRRSPCCASRRCSSRRSAASAASCRPPESAGGAAHCTARGARLAPARRPLAPRASDRPTAWRAWRSFFGVELSVLPGGMRLHDMFALSTIGEVKEVLQHEFQRGGLFTPAYMLRLLLVRGLDVRLHAIDEEGRATASVPLQERLRFTFNDGGRLHFHVLTADEAAAWEASRYTAAADRSVLRGPVHMYRPAFEPGPQHTLNSILEVLQVVDETGDRKDYAAAREQLGWEVHVDLDGLPEAFDVPNATRWPVRPPQRPLMFNGEELEYGDNDLEGIRDSDGKAFWGVRYNDDTYFPD